MDRLTDILKSSKTMNKNMQGEWKYYNENCLVLCSCLILYSLYPANIFHMLSSQFFFWCAVLVLFVVTWCQMYALQPLQNKYSKKQKSFVVNKVLPCKYNISKNNGKAFPIFELDINLLDLKVSQWKLAAVKVHQFLGLALHV